VLKSEVGFVENVHESDEKLGTLSQGRAADDVALESPVAVKKGLVEGSIGISSDEVENAIKGDSVPKSVTAVSRKTEKVTEEVGIAHQARVDEKRVEQQLPALAAHSSKGISVKIVRDGQKAQETQGAIVKSVPEVGVVDPAGDRSKGSVEGRATVQRLSVKNKQAGRSSSAAVASMSTQLVSAVLTETGSTSVDQEKTINVEQSKERTTLADQQKILLMSPVNGTSTHHTVSKGDTLWEISEQYTGSGFNYPDVAKKNKITNPDLIYPNQQVALPAKK